MAVPSFLGLYGFPNSYVNAQVVHGIPNNTPLKSGDVISVDCGAYKMDIMEIMRTFEIGEVDPETKNYYKLPKNPCTWVFVSLRLEIV
jgi:methionyl aminopeptidase